MDKKTSQPKTYSQKEVDSLIATYDINAKIDGNYEKTVDLFQDIKKEIKDMSTKITSITTLHKSLEIRISAIEEELKFDRHDREVKRKEMEDQKTVSEKKLYEIYQKVGIVSGIIGIAGGAGVYAVIHFLLFKN